MKTEEDLEEILRREERLELRTRNELHVGPHLGSEVRTGQKILHDRRGIHETGENNFETGLGKRF